MRRILAVMVVAVTSLAITIDTSVSSVHALPPGFSDVTLPGPATNPLSSLTAITAIPDGRALILEKDGAVRVLLADGTLSATDALNLSANCVHRRRGGSARCCHRSQLRERTDSSICTTRTTPATVPAPPAGSTACRDSR